MTMSAPRRIASTCLKRLAPPMITTVRRRRLTDSEADRLVDLQRQFACRRQDQRPGCEGRRADLLGGEVLQHRQGEGGGLAAAGLGDAQKVLVRPAEAGWYRPGLVSEFRICAPVMRAAAARTSRGPAKVVWVKTKDMLQRPSFFDGRRALVSSSPRAIKWGRTVFRWKFPELRARKTAR